MKNIIESDGKGIIQVYMDLPKFLWFLLSSVIAGISIIGYKLFIDTNGDLTKVVQIYVVSLLCVFIYLMYLFFKGDIYRLNIFIKTVDEGAYYTNMQYSISRDSYLLLHKIGTLYDYFGSIEEYVRVYLNLDKETYTFFLTLQQVDDNIVLDEEVTILLTPKTEIEIEVNPEVKE